MSGMPDGIECLESHVTSLTAENKRLRANLEEMTWRRDALLEAARAVLNSAGSSFSEQEVKKRFVRERARETLRVAVDACAALRAASPPPGEG